MSEVDDDALFDMFSPDPEDMPCKHDFDDPFPCRRNITQDGAANRVSMEEKELEEEDFEVVIARLRKKNAEKALNEQANRPNPRAYPIERSPEIHRVVFKSVAEGNEAEQRKSLVKYRTLVGKTLPLLPGADMTHKLERIAHLSPWLESAIHIIQRSIRLGSHRADIGFRLERPILLVGPPGIGKSWLVSQMRQHLGLPSLSISAAGKTDNMALRGTARGWTSAREGEIVQLIAEHRCANPLVVIDELDKVSPETRNGNLQQTLLQMFDPLNACQWRDEYLLGEVDLSAISWLATANSIKDIIEPLRERMDIIHLQGPRNLIEKRRMLHSMAWDVAHGYGLLSPGAAEHPATWPDYIQDEELIQTLLQTGNNFRMYRKLLLGVLDRWMQNQAKRLM